MSSYAGERELEFKSPLRGLLDRLQALELHTSLEFWLYVAIVATAAALRFTDLGARALHHDESLHAYYSWRLFKGMGYVHDPLMHGPFLFHVTAFVYLLLGASDATSRFAPAFFGTLLVAAPLLLRPWLGRVGALATALLIALSPSLLYYSRFIRNESWVALWTIGLFACLLRYRSSRGDRWLFGAAAFLMLEFVSKETAFIIALILLLYLSGAAAADLTDTLDERFKLSPLRRAAVFVGLLPTAWLVVVLWPLSARMRERFGMTELPASGVLLLILGLLTAPQFSAAVRKPLEWLHYDLTQEPTRGYTLIFFGHHVTRMELAGTITVVLLLLITTAVGLLWDWKRWLIICAVFYVPYFLLYTTFLTNRHGWGSGIWGSLSYWIDQQPVNRGRQPVFYFTMTLPAYEYLALGLAALGLVIHAARRGLESFGLLILAIGLLPCIAFVNATYGNTPSIPVVLVCLSCATLAMGGDVLRRMMVFYFGALLFGLSVAGEKMPWLTVHLALPLVILAGLAVNDLLGFVPKLARALQRYVWGAAGVVLACGAVLGLVLASKGAGTVTRVGAAAAFAAVAVGVGLALFVLLRRQRELPEGLRWRWLPAGVVGFAAIAGLLGVLTVRNDYRMNWVHPDTPDEMLIYTQTAPDLPIVMKQIDQLAQESGQGHNLKVIVDSNDAFAWPWVWYLRDYHNTVYPDPSAIAAYASPGSVLLLNAQDLNVVPNVASNYGAGERYHHRWWFPEEGYRTTTAARFFSRLRDGSELRRWWTYITNRDGFVVPPSDVNPGNGNSAQGNAPVFRSPTDTQSLGAVDAIAYFPANWTPGKGLNAAGPVAPAAPAAPTAKTNGTTLVVGGAGAGAMQAPAGVASDTAGNIFEVETTSGLVRKLDSSGHQLAATNLSQSGLRLNQPWGIAVGPDGSVYVADTWNHRIVKLTSDLQLVTAWGSLGQGQPSPLLLYGPRSIVADATGNLWVTDTGNARVVEFNPNGQPLGTYGERGSGPGQFLEPVGIAVGPDGNFYVADTWNNRIEVFDATFKYVREFTVAGWVDAQGNGTDQNNKPYLAVLPDGSIVATFPEKGQIVRYDRDGNVLATLNRLPGMDTPLQHPVGVAAAANGAILLADGVLNEVVRAPASAVP